MTNRSLPSEFAALQLHRASEEPVCVSAGRIRPRLELGRHPTHGQLHQSRAGHYTLHVRGSTTTESGTTRACGSSCTSRRRSGPPGGSRALLALTIVTALAWSYLSRIRAERGAPSRAEAEVRAENGGAAGGDPRAPPHRREARKRGGGARGAERSRRRQAGTRARPAPCAHGQHSRPHLFQGCARGRFTRINRAFADALGLTEVSDAVGPHHCGSSPRIWPCPRSATSARSSGGEALLGRVGTTPRSGRWYLASKVLSATRRDSVAGLVGISKDINSAPSIR